jgi:hypothetical protein
MHLISIYTILKGFRFTSIIILLSFFTFTSIAQTSLSAGDIAIIGWNGDDDDDVLLVSFVDIEAGTVIYLTDKSWDGSAFTSSEGYNQYTVPEEGVSAGDVILISNNNDSPTSSNGGTVVEISGFNFSGSGDELYLYQGADEATPTGFIFAIATKTSWGENELLNTGLTDGTNALAIWGANDDNGEYTGARIGSQSELIALISDSDNWSTTDGSGDQSITFTTTAFTLNDGNAPVFTSEATVAVNENTIGVIHTLTAMHAQSITYTLGNANDELLFSLNAGSGELNFITAPDFENPQDGNEDNVYVIEAIASDGVNETSQTVSITVIDLIEDLSAPLLISSSPSDGATGYGGSIITLTFDSNILKGAGTISVLDKADDSPLFLRGVRHPDINVEGNVVTINMKSPLSMGKEVYVNISNTAFRSIQGDFYTGISDKTNLNFFTPTAPAMVSSTPIDGATDFDDTTITLNFDRDMQKGYGRISIMDVTNDAELWAVGVNHPHVSIDGSLVTIDFKRPFPLDKEIYMNIGPNAFRDGDGNFFQGFSDNSTLNFSTVTSPKLISSSPADGAIGFDGTTIILTFDREVYKGTGRIALLDAADDTELWFKGINNHTISIDGVTVTLDLKSPLGADKDVYLNIAPTVFKDVNNNFYAGLADKTTLNFSTQSSGSGFPASFNISDEESRKTELQVGVYPNPASYEVTIDLSAVGEKPTVTITNLSGMEMFSKAEVETQQLTVDVSSYSQGVFLITIKTETGEVIRKKMSVIKR